MAKKIPYFDAFKFLTTHPKKISSPSKEDLDKKQFTLKPSVIESQSASLEALHPSVVYLEV
jgi:hypothetical protein